MSLHGRMVDTFEIYERAAETDTQVQVGSVRGYVTALNAEGARRASALLEPDVTHSGRFAKHERLTAGRRIRRARDGAEFVVRVVREQGPQPGHYHATLGEVSEAL